MDSGNYYGALLHESGGYFPAHYNLNNLANQQYLAASSLQAWTNANPIKEKPGGLLNELRDEISRWHGNVLGR